jgi:hypothetical protein
MGLFCVSCEGADAYFVVEAKSRREANKLVNDAICFGDNAVNHPAPSFERVRQYHEKEKKKRRVALLRLLTAEPLEMAYCDLDGHLIYDISLNDE